LFPLDVDGVSGYYLGQADHLPIVQSVSADEGWVAQGAWVLAFLAMRLATVTMLASAFYGADTARAFITFSVRPFAYHDGAGITSLASGTGQGDVMTATAPFRVGGWLPSDQAFLDQWVGDLVAKVEAEATSRCSRSSMSSGG
jgi:hypothetical protein